ncbi:unnamed protein product [Linum trigynum]|uniref:DNA-directed RNA polymerase n=1 Tax=Linum trigynum TaxID=586398 RepID=A0AAV2G9V0_9ROSI
MIEFYVDEEHIDKVYAKVKVGHLYRDDDIVDVPAKRKGRIVPRELQLIMKSDQLISHIEEDEDNPEHPIGSYLGAYFSMVPMQRDTYACHAGNIS